MGNLNVWKEYERRKRAILALNLDPIAYREAIAALCRELGL